jgi:hypothetical protein
VLLVLVGPSCARGGGYFRTKKGWAVAQHLPPQLEKQSSEIKSTGKNAIFRTLENLIFWEL